jgi:putative addiction module component (TIGR02574 family)
MANMVDQALRDRVSRLSQADRLELIGELWQSIEVDELEVTQAERELLDDRLADLHDDPAAGRSWDAVEADLRNRLR